MNKKLALVLSIMSISLCAAAQLKTSASEIDGVWIPIRQELGGTEFPPEGFAKHKLVINDTSFTYLSENTEKGALKFNGHKLDIYGREGINKGRHFATIYKYEKGLLTICYNLQGDSYPETFETEGKSNFFISVFKKEEPK